MVDRLEKRESLTMLVTVGTRTDAHCLRRKVRIGSESDCSLGQLTEKDFLGFPLQMQVEK